jgi:hypothetical protein
VKKQPVPEKAIAKQRASYAALLNSLGHALFDEIEQVMAKREQAKPEKGLTTERVAKLQSRIVAKRPEAKTKSARKAQS